MKRFLSVFLVIIMAAGLFVLRGSAAKAEVISVSGSNAGGIENSISVTSSTARWSSIRNSYLFKSSSGYTAVDWNGSKVIVTEYDSKFNKDSVKIIEPELPLFGGFYASKDCNYILFGDTNYSEDDTKEVLRLVKYDKDFNRIISGSVTDCYTFEPFESGSAVIAETNGYVIIQTCRKRYPDDGVRHQSSLTVIMDKATLSILNDLGKFQANHVSHSFNQFVMVDGHKFVVVDHGDAYPRSVTLNVLDTDTTYYSGAVSLFDIPGTAGANCTGVTVGGLAISSSSYMVAINSVDHSKVTSYDSFKMYSLDVDERNAMVLVESKSDKKVKEVVLTNYVNKGYLASTPYIVKINDDEFAVLWQEFKYGSSNADLKYAVIDGSGNIRSTGSSSNAILSVDCQPIYDNGKIIWYVNSDSTNRDFYKLNVFDDSPETTGDDEYTVTFKANGSVVSKKNLKEGEKIVKPSDPTLSGWTFKRWDPEVPSTMPAKDMTFTAVFERNPGTPDTPGTTSSSGTTGTTSSKYYSATFIADGVVVSKISRLEGQALVPPADPVKPGYVFKGWDPEVPATIQPKDMTFTAVFEDDYGTPYTTVPTSTTSPSVTPDQFSGFTIRNYQSTLTVGYKSNLVFHTTIDAPYGYTIVWSNGQTGSRCEFNEVTDSSYIVSAKLVKDGVVVKETPTETVSVRTGILGRLMYFFRTLLGRESTYVDNVKSN